MLSPWVWMLFFGEPPLGHLLSLKLNDWSIMAAMSQILSFENIFFRNSDKVFFITGELGFLLPSFIILIFLGLWYFLTTKKGVLRVFAVFMLFSFFLCYSAGFLAFFLILPFLSVFAAVGFSKILEYGQENLFLRVLFLLNFFLLIYEGLRMFRIIQIQLAQL